MKFLFDREVSDVRLAEKLVLRQVLFILDFKCNLISVSCMTKDLNCILTFLHDCCFVQDLPTRNLIGLGRRCDEMYYFDSVQDRGVVLKVQDSDNHSYDIEGWAIQIKRR